MLYIHYLKAQYTQDMIHHNICIHLLWYHGKYFPNIQEYINFKIKLDQNCNLNIDHHFHQSKYYMYINRIYTNHCIQNKLMDKLNNINSLKKIDQNHKLHSLHKYIYTHIKVWYQYNGLDILYNINYWKSNILFYKTNIHLASYQNMMHSLKYIKHIYYSNFHTLHNIQSNINFENILKEDYMINKNFKKSSYMFYNLNCRVNISFQFYYYNNHLDSLDYNYCLISIYNSFQHKPNNI